jgi:hypothetical protein
MADYDAATFHLIPGMNNVKDEKGLESLTYLRTSSQGT